MWMQDFEQLAGAEQERFKKVANYLLNKSYVLREIYENRDRIGKINADYRFLERNFPLFSEYLDYAGYNLVKDDAFGIISLNNRYEYNILKVDKFTTTLLLTLRIIYDEEKEKNASRNVVFIRVSDVIYRMLEDRLLLKKPTIKDTTDTLRTLIRHNIIARLEGQIEDPTCLITIYPTIIKVVSNDKINALYEVMFKEVAPENNPYAFEKEDEDSEEIK